MREMRDAGLRSGNAKKQFQPAVEGDEDRRAGEKRRTDELLLGGNRGTTMRRGNTIANPSSSPKSPPEAPTVG